MELLKMTLKQYYENPYGKGSTFANAPAIKQNLSDRYNVLRNNHKFTHKIYALDGMMSREYYILIDVPSETLDRMNYQVLVKLTQSENSNGTTIDNYNVKFFSNSPSFIFTHAYVFNLFGLFIEELGDKYDKKVLTKEPIVKNYYKIIGYEKSLFFAVSFILNNLHEISKLDKSALVIDEFDDIKSLIFAQNEIMIKYDARKKAHRDKVSKDPRYALMHKVKKEIKRTDKRKKPTTNPNKVARGENRNLNTQPSNKITGKSKIGGRSKIKGKKKIK